NTHTQQGWNDKSQDIQGSALVRDNSAELRKNDASQLQFPPPDKVVVKTKADYDGESKKGKLRSPKIAEFSISIIEGVSERLKVRLMSPLWFSYLIS
ncbi:hypothetical protein CHARACLAT_032013, partial [Characodon lateralis]|nr:hypothetical protein [Characodon lateralis]